MTVVASVATISMALHHHGGRSGRVSHRRMHRCGMHGRVVCLSGKDGAHGRGVVGSCTWHHGGGERNSGTGRGRIEHVYRLRYELGWLRGEDVLVKAFGF